MSKIKSNIHPFGFLGRPLVKALTGLGAFALLVDPSSALAQSRACSVEFSVTSATELGALQLSVDYLGAADVGAFAATPDCDFVPAGITDSHTDADNHLLGVGWADTVGFTGPASFVSCRFILPDAADATPLSSDFLVTVVDASDTNIPPAPVSPTVSAAVGSCAEIASDCANGLLEQGEQCDDGNLLGGDGCGPTCASTGSCAAEPLAGCKGTIAAGKSKILLKDDTKNPGSSVNDQGQYQWKAGVATDVSEFSDPVGGSAVYSWCVYENDVVVRGSDVPAGGTCSGKPCWTASGTTGFGFKGDIDGVSQIKMKAGAAGKSSVQVKAKSKAGGFAAPALPLTTPVLSQFVVDNGVTPVCFETEFSTVKKSDEKQFSAVGPE